MHDGPCAGKYTACLGDAIEGESDEASAAAVVRALAGLKLDVARFEKVALFAVLKPGESLTLGDVRAFLTEQGVAKFKWPERLEIVDALPRNPLNKVVRAELAARLKPA